jgi:hypothetical protein
MYIVPGFRHANSGTCVSGQGCTYHANSGTCEEPDGNNPGFCDAGTDCTDCTAYRVEHACEGVDCGHFTCNLGACTEACAQGWMGEVCPIYIPLAPAAARR